MAGGTVATVGGPSREGFRGDAARERLAGLLRDAKKPGAVSTQFLASAAVLQAQARTRGETTRERRQQVHDLLDQGVGLLERAHRLQLALNTVKRCARVAEPQQLKKAPRDTGPPWSTPTASTCAAAALPNTGWSATAPPCEQHQPTGAVEPAHTRRRCRAGNLLTSGELRL